MRIIVTKWGKKMVTLVVAFKTAQFFRLLNIERLV